MIRKLPLLAFLAVSLSVSGLSAAPIKLGKRHKDESNGFKFQPPTKWDQVPTKFKDVTVVGKWVAGRAKRGWYAAQLQVLRFLKASARSPEERAKPPAGGPQGIPGYAGLFQGQPKDVFDYIKRSFLFRKFNIVEDDTDFKMKGKDLTAHFRVYHENVPKGMPGRDIEKGQTMIVAAQVTSRAESDSTYGILFLCTVADTKDMLSPFKTCIRRFRILEPDEEDEEDQVSDADLFVDSETKPEVWRDVRKAKLIPGWGARDTQNYLIIYNKEVKKNLLKTIAKHIEAIRGQVYEQLFPPASRVTAISVVRVCKDKAEYHKYGGPGGSAGYWSPGDEELVFYQDKSNKKDSLRVLYHEAFHQYIHYAVGKVAPHSWFNEGHGDYFAGHNYKGKRFIADVFRWRTGIISNAIARKSYVPLEDFLTYTQGQYYSNPGLCYAQGWSFVYFLREAERLKIKKYKKYWGLLDKYFAMIKANVKLVKEKGLYGLEDLDDKEKEGEGTGEDAVPAEPESGLTKVPGIEKPFPGEHPAAGAAPEPEKVDTTTETKTVAGPQIKGIKSGLDKAVKDVFGKLDLSQLEKDWIEFIKKHG
jgi:hypothetical protein